MTPDAVFQACPSGPVSGARRSFFEKNCGVAGSEPVTPGRALFVWVADLLYREVPNHADGVTMWVTDSGVLESEWDLLAGSGDGPPPPLTVSDGRVVWVTGGRPPFDLGTGKPAGYDTGDGWFHVSVFNLRALYQLCSDKAEKWTTQQQKSGQTPTPRPPVS